MSANLTAILAAVLLFVAGLAFYQRMRTGKRRKLVSKRMAELTKLEDTGKPSTAVDANDLFRDIDNRNRKGFIGALQKAVEDALMPAGGMSKLREVILIGVTSSVAGAVVCAKVLGLPSSFAIVAAVFLLLFVPYSYLKSKANSRRQKFLDAFPDAIDLVVRAIKAGIPTSESINTAGRELAEPLGGEFKRIGQEVAIGVAPDRALSEAAARVRISDFNFFAVTLTLQRETGGNLAETLENLAALLRKRKEMRLKVKALTSEARFTSKVIGSLPIIVMLALYFLNRSYVGLMFTDPVAQIFFGIAVSLVVVGSIVMNKLVNMEI